ncbi:MAG: acyl carrier protein [Pseudonocardia sp.]
MTAPDVTAPDVTALDVTAPDRSAASFAEVRALVVDVLGLAADRAAAITPATPLLGGFSEFDSMAVLEIVTELETRFGLVVDDDEITAEVFATVGSLAGLVTCR